MAVPGDAGIRLQGAVEDFHESGLARAVLAEQGVDLTGMDGEFQGIVGQQIAEAFGDAFSREKRLARPGAFLPLGALCKTFQLDPPNLWTRRRCRASFVAVQQPGKIGKIEQGGRPD